MTEKDNSNFVERFTVRMPDGMRDAMAERAKRNGRSMNSEIVQILQDALETEKLIAETDIVDFDSTQAALDSNPRQRKRLRFLPNWRKEIPLPLQFFVRERNITEGLLQSLGSAWVILTTINSKTSGEHDGMDYWRNRNSVSR